MRRVLLPVFIFLLIAFGPGICRADTAMPADTLTVEQAIDLALNNRQDVLSAGLNVDAALIGDELTMDQVNLVIEGSRIPGTNQFASAGTAAYNQMYTSDYNIQAAQKNYDTKLESVKFSVYQKYYNVVTALDSTDAQRLASQQAEEKLAISQLRYQLGMDTKLAVYQAQMQAVSARGNYGVAQQSLDQKYIALMEYIGWPNSHRPALVRELTYHPVEVNNPESKFKDIVNDSPGVWLAKKSLDLRELTRVNSNDLEGELADIQQEQAEITVITTKDAMLQATRNIYYNVLSMQESYAAAKEGAQVADEALRVAKLLYEAGMGTKLDVTAAEIAAHNAHQTLNSLSYQHAILKMAFEKPWAYGSAN
jgi:outer membrane protein TolC